MHILRSLKQLAARAAPESIKAPLRGRRYGYWRARAAVPHRITSTQDGFRVLLAYAPRGHEPHWLAPITLSPAGLAALDDHLTRNGESIEEMHAFLRFAVAGPGVLIDVGANHGSFTLAFCAARSDNTAVAFEPATEPLAHLRQSVDASGFVDRVRPVHALLGATPGMIEGGINGNGMFTPGVSDGTPPVQRVTLDGHIAASGVRPTLLKIDVDGAELDVLEGARDTLRTCRPVVFLELHHDLLELGGVEPDAVMAVLEDAGYRYQTLLGRPLPFRRILNTTRALIRFVAVPR
jgi:FkbM family methyltransferase